MLKNQILIYISIFTLLFGAVSNALAANQDKKELIIEKAWARKPIGSNNNSAAYMKITNSSAQPITILGATASNVANNVELHKSYVDEQGVSRMAALDKLVIPAHTTVELSPNGIHIMLIDLKKTLEEGSKIEITLQIENSNPIKFKALIRNN
ncbi:MAG: copper chaperone PCu(A)C [Rickettsiales bacterium]|nr:copper chaperone PCu(A)C [Rickettsiales bacterium]MCA0254191.1 copper chaperone PCu(A)C [Pseudomonadota bacterium]